MALPKRGLPNSFPTCARAGLLTLCILLVTVACSRTDPNDGASLPVHSASDKCRLLVASNVRGARILIDGRDLGRTRQAVELGCGEHRVRVERAGYQPFERSLRLTPGRLESVDAVLSPLAADPIDQPVGAHVPEPTSPASDCPITVGGTSPEQGPRNASFSKWLEEYKRQARSCGIPPKVIETAFKGVRPLNRLLKHDRKQAEYSKTFFGYLNGRVSSGLINTGRKRIKRHRALLKRLEGEYGVPAEILVALWGLESGYGAVTGNTPVIAALSTLAYDGRRRDFYQRELLSALRILEQGRIEPNRMLGSWAGAMGQPQFMPSTYLDWGVDADNDGRIDIWRSVPDALESAANYLAGIKWQRGQPWGAEVKLPEDFDAYQARLSEQRSNRTWDTRGVRLANGRPLPASDMTGSIILPAGIRGPAFLVYNNFRVITEWNKSLFYALSVGRLSDRLAGKGRLVGKAPPGDKPLKISLVKAMQADLNTLGFGAGKPDGMVGKQTRQALRDYQRSRGMVADAYPTPELAARLRREDNTASGEVPTDLGHQDILHLQQQLARLGYQVGTPDGVMGPTTRKAMRTYLRKRGLEPVNEPTREIIEQLASEPDT
ncbi:MAG: lytic murein transglycosylase [Candidatus Thiosymbion ectosymbiont of Robbea hypermnestra]|nr:lytic murein transglycosylase [Candidatus Thiosymbion ectosymbiont of Robbea hypermnestra]